MAQAPFRTAAITATGDITFGASGQLTVTAANGNLATSGSVQGATLTDGTFSTTAGAVTGVTTLTASGLVTSVGLDAGAGAITTTGTLSSGATTVDSLDASSGGITNAGAIAGATTITASGQITSVGVDAGSGVITTTGAINGADITATGTITDGAFSTTGGAVTGVTTLAMSGILTVGSGGTTYSFPTARGTANQILKLMVLETCLSKTTAVLLDPVVLPATFNSTTVRVDLMAMLHLIGTPLTMFWNSATAETLMLVSPATPKRSLVVLPPLLIVSLKQPMSLLNTSLLLKTPVQEKFTPRVAYFG